MTNLTQVAVVGAGNMGGGMLARLLGLGWSVAVRDIDPRVQSQAVALGAVACGSAMEAARMLAPDGVLMVVVVDAAQTEAVLWGEGGAGPVLKPGQSVMLCPTLGPATVQSQAERLAPMGIDFIDAPMSGGPVRAQEGTMSLMVACSDAVWQRSQKLLTALSQQVFRVGTRAGDGARTKLVNNLLAAVNLAGAAEAMALAERLGLDPAATLSVIEASSGQSWIGSDRMRRALAGDFEPRAHVTLLAKDTGLAVQAADDVAFDPPLGRLARDLFAQALGRGWADLDDAALLKLMRQR
ncbi:NAD(P)-dependent oxidoreductase [Limnohabitans sp. 2KL-51]|jgi:3-hydroxyisobutyrate dehydrogenase|uniref:NAD(P)-dependent oxidoreductase n=1 Tax=Limnohabitans sp. 2KL-51 TaxID=1977911 RepID=UPI000D354CD7|nr:NAD(P)-dependent oxidoreductase [Limnohabitans sp. 2KL-51]PUE45109.1 hydroxyacid dehydrogenase [Limnohabitans sp. 2KL-51]